MQFYDYDDRLAALDSGEATTGFIFTEDRAFVAVSETLARKIYVEGTPITEEQAHKIWPAAKLQELPNLP